MLNKTEEYVQTADDHMIARIGADLRVWAGNQTRIERS